MKAMVRMNAHQRQQAHRAIRSMVAQEIEKERSDIATRAMYLALIACQQVGLSARTLRRIAKTLPLVTERYADYKTEGLADEWARMTLAHAGVDVPETGEKL
ncbi:MAG: hypothetical protein ACI4OI_07145 [Gemmiger sp.]